jgi:hypothetical protein
MVFPKKLKGKGRSSLTLLIHNGLDFCLLVYVLFSFYLNKCSRSLFPAFSFHNLLQKYQDKIPYQPSTLLFFCFHIISLGIVKMLGDLLPYYEIKKGITPFH